LAISRRSGWYSGESEWMATSNVNAPCVHARTVSPSR